MNLADRCPDYAGLLQQLIEQPDGETGAHCARCAERLNEMRSLTSALKPIGVELQPSAAERDPGLIDRIIGAARLALAEAPEAQRALALTAAARELFHRDWARARELAANAREIACKLKTGTTPAERALTRMARAECAAVLGNCLIHLDRLDEGETLIREAIEQFEESGDLLASGRARINLTRALYLRKAFEEAIICAHTAVRDLEAIGEPLWAARARHDLAIALYDLHRFDEAEKQFHTTQAVYGREGKHEEQAMVLVTLGKIALEKNHPDNALAKSLHAEALLHWAGNSVDAARSRWLAGSAHLALGEQSEGLRDLDDAATRLLARGLWIEPALIRCEQALALLDTGDAMAARRRLREVAALCPADEGNAWVRDAVLALEVDHAMDSTDLLRSAINRLKDRLELPQAPAELGVTH